MGLHMYPVDKHAALLVFTDGGYRRLWLSTEPGGSSGTSNSMSKDTPLET